MNVACFVLGHRMSNVEHATIQTAYGHRTRSHSKCLRCGEVFWRNSEGHGAGIAEVVGGRAYNVRQFVRMERNLWRRFIGS
jgi:hypothetical protein